MFLMEGGDSLKFWRKSHGYTEEQHVSGKDDVEASAGAVA